jgi:WD40 repeat protein
VRTLAGHQKPITALAVSPDGQQLFSAAQGQSRVWVWDLAAGTVAKKLTAFFGGGALACAGGGKWLLAAGTSAGMMAWELPSGRAHVDLAAPGTNNYTSSRPSVAAHPDGRLVAFARTARGDGGQFLFGVQVWDLVTGERVRLLEGFGAEVVAVAYSPDGNLLAVADAARTVRLFDGAGTEVRRFAQQRDAIVGIAFRPDGAALAVACGNAASIWDVRAGEVAGESTPHERDVTAVAYSPDGRYLASAGRDGYVRLHDAATLTLFGRRHAEAGPLGALCWLPDSSALAVGGNKLLTVCAVDELLAGTVPRSKPRGEPLSLSGHTSTVEWLAYSPNGRALCSLGRGEGLRMWDLSGGAGQAKRCEGFSGDAYTLGVLSWSPDSERLSLRAAGTSALILDARTGEMVRSLTYPNAYAHTLAFTPAGRLFVAVMGDGVRLLLLKLRGPEGDEVLFSKLAPLGVDQCVIPSGAEDQRIYFVSMSQSVYRWTPSSDQLDILFEQKAGITGFAVGADEKLALWRGGNCAYFRPLTGGKSVKLKHSLTCSGAAFLSGGRIITSCYDGIVRVWDEAGGQMQTLDLGMGKIYSFALSPDHMTFAAGVHKKSRIVLMDVPD